MLRSPDMGPWKTDGFCDLSDFTLDPCALKEKPLICPGTSMWQLATCWREGAQTKISIQVQVRLEIFNTQGPPPFKEHSKCKVGSIPSKRNSFDYYTHIQIL